MKKTTFDKHKLQIAISSILLIVAFGYLFKDVIVNLVNIWLDDGNYSHGFLVPIVVGYFIWLKREELQGTPVRPFWPALPLVILFGLMLIAGQLAIHGFVKHLALILMILSLTLLILGKHWLRILAVPLVFLVFMFPLPFFLKKNITEPLQILSSFISVNFLHLLDYPIYREGNILYLSDMTLSVAEACSGLRSIVALTFGASVIGYLTFKSKWKILITLLCALVVAIVLNWVRIVGTVVLADIWDSERALKFFHDFSGTIVILVAIVIVTAFIIFIKKRGASSAARIEKLGHSLFEIKSIRCLSILLSAGILIGLTLYGNVIFASKPPPVDISRLPLKFDGYKGSEQKIAPDITTGTGVTHDRSIVYRNSQHPPINLYLGYYRTRRDQSAFVHSPDTCLPGSGWKTLKKEVIPLNAGENRNGVIKYVSKMGPTQQILITWIQSGKITVTDHRQMIFNALYSSMYKLRFGDATKVMISTIISQSETEQEAEDRLLDFIHKFYPVFIELSV